MTNLEEETMTFKARCAELESLIQSAYEDNLTLEQAEKLAGNFLHATLQASSELSKADLDARTRKSGVKAIRAGAYLEIVQNADKKPTDSNITALIDANVLVIGEQKSLDEAEVLKAELERFYDIFNQAHIYFRQISKGVQG